MAGMQPSGGLSPAFSAGKLILLILLSAGCARSPQARATAVLVPPTTAPADNPVLWHEPFDAIDPDRWKPAEVSRGPTLYSVVTLEGRSCLRAVSQDSASILLSPLQFDPETYEWISWEWRVEQFVDGEALERKDGSDASARLYVYFQTMGLPWQKRSLDYVWSKTLPYDTLLNSAFAPASKILVLESGAGGAGRWRAEERNLERDFERAFGKQNLPQVIGIGVMTDTDNTKGTAVAYFDDLRVSRSAAHPAGAEDR